MARRVDQILATDDLHHAVVGVLVRSLDDGRVVFERNADLALVPASNQKLLTAAAALARLGPQFRFRTSVFRTGKIDKGGTLHGDLVLRGSGDPSLTSARLGALARAVRAAGIRRVAGRIIADDTRFDDQRLGDGWQWDDESFNYQPQVSALNCDGNVVTLQIRPGRAPGRNAVGSGAGAGYVRTEIAVVTGGANDRPQLQAERLRGRNVLRVRGSIPLSSQPVAVTLTIEEPAVYAATRFRQTLVGQRIAVPHRDRVVRGGTPSGAVPIGDIRSETLSVLLRHFLKSSDNLYGEAFWKTLGAEIAGDGSWSAGGQVVAAFLETAGVDLDALSPADGSGLSRLNAVTPRNLVALLTYVRSAASSELRNPFVAALPIAGVDGTLRHRLRGTSAAGNLRAKTGSLSGVSALSGYVTTKAGERLVFSILMNSLLQGARAGRTAQDQLILALLDCPRPGSDAAPAHTPPAAADR